MTSNHEKSKSTIGNFVLLVTYLLGYALIFGGISGVIATYFDLDLAMKIGGSKIDLIKDYFANITLVITGGFFLFLAWAFSQKKVINTLKKNKTSLIVIIAVIIIGLFIGGKAIVINLEGGPAMWAISNNDLEGLKTAFNETTPTEAEKSQMLFRALQKDTEIVKYLLSNGANPNSKRHDGLPALEAACTWGKEGTTEALKKAGATGECKKY